MAGSFNRATILGNLGRDPEVRSLQNGAKVVNLTVATSERWNDKASGERKELTEWHRVTVFNTQIADLAERYLKKGSSVLIEGKLQTRKYEKDGIDRYATEIVVDQFNGKMVLLGSKDDNERSSGAPSNQGGHSGSTRSNSDGWGSKGGRKPSGDLDDDIPF